MLTPLTAAAEPSRDFLVGIVEGFYGRPWGHEDRLAYADLLPALGLNSYLYCPKSDSCLRRHWQRHWPAADWARLRQLADTCASRQLAFGVGLSPFALYRRYGAGERAQLEDKVSQLRELGGSLLALLFDDMPGEVADLAERQAEITVDVAGWAPELRLLMCPTYYSFDPVLERYFGAMPADYWARLGALLPAAVDIFWTGNAVCSEHIDRADLTTILAKLGRSRLVLWDNYPVNDGAIRSKHLYIDPLAGRDAASADLLAGHFCNPMSQSLLSLPALSGLASLYRRSILAPDWLASRLGIDCWSLLQRDRLRFGAGGLDDLSPAEREALAQEYAACSGRAAREVAGWLRGEYAFDPACLTD